MDIVTQNQQTVQCEILTDSGQTVEHSSGHSDTEPSTGLSLVNKANLVYNFVSKFITFLYIFGATTCPSSRETTLSMRHLVLVTLKQVDSIKLNGT